VSATAPAEAATSSSPPAAQAEPAAKKGRSKLILGAIVTAALLGAGNYWRTHAGREATDDAQVEADVVGVPARVSGVITKVAFQDDTHVKAGDLLAELDPAPFQAKVAQAKAQVAAAAAEAAANAADADAHVAELGAQGQKSVAQASLAGASVGATESRAALQQAQAQVDAATAGERQAKMDFEKVSTLVAQDALPKQQLEKMRTAYDEAKAALDLAKANLLRVQAAIGGAQSRIEEANARVTQTKDVNAYVAQARAHAQTLHAQADTARAALAMAELELSYTKVLAPADGVVSKRSVSPGQMVGPGQVIVSLVPDATRWVVGNFKETLIEKMRIGQPATVAVDAYSGRELRGEVEGFAAATGSRFSLLPPDNASGNYTKVVQRVPVRIKLLDAPQDLALRPGMSVELIVDVRK
jgi:membrane fusion protein (multidrug efflux system)